MPINSKSISGLSCVFHVSISSSLEELELLNILIASKEESYVRALKTKACLSWIMDRKKKKGKKTGMLVCIALTKARESLETVLATSVRPLRYFLVAADS